MKSHPDRCAPTLANVEAARERQGEGPFLMPGPGSRDARIDLKLLEWRALQACNRSAAARARLDAFDPMLRPDLWAGTVQDGTARGFAAALEEAIALAPPPPPAPELPDEPGCTEVLEGKVLRRTKDLLVKTGGARVRFSRKGGLLFVDRERDVHSSNALRFEARTDDGTLDEFVPREDERPRLFSAQFMQPVRYATAPGFSELVLEGGLGRGRAGWPCRLRITGLAAEATVRLELSIDNHHRDLRLRARFLGVAPEQLAHECTDVSEQVDNDAGGFVAFTLVRAVSALVVDGDRVPVPAGQCKGSLRHVFHFGAR